MRKISSIFLICVLCLTGCAPISYTYHRLELPGGENLRTGKCGGPPDQLRFSMNGIFISVRIDAIVIPNFGVNFDVPSGKTVRLQTDKATLIFKQGNETLESKITLVPYGGSLNVATDLMVGNTTQRKVFFGTEDIYKWFTFKPSKEPVSAGESGQLVLPNMYIDEVFVPGPSIPFRKVTTVSIDSLNC